jgi:hypothetical protein
MPAPAARVRAKLVKLLAAAGLTLASRALDLRQ